MPNKIKITVLILFSVLVCFGTYKLCYFVAEKYFFDKFFYKKSALYGYSVSPSNYFGDRNKDLQALESNRDQKVFSASSNNRRYQITIIGDSYVYGIGIKDNERFAKLLEKKLNQLRPTKVTIISAVCSSPINYVGWYNKLKAITNPNIYIFALVNNDALIRPDSNLNPADNENIVANCQNNFPAIKPVLDPSVVFSFQNNFINNQDINQISLSSIENSWSNPINLCVLNNSLHSLPTDNAIYFITDNYNNNNKYKIYQDYLEKNNKYIISSTLGKNIPNYSKYWQNPNQNFHVSPAEIHPNALANQMYADILFNEITTNPKWGFTKQILR